MQVLKLNSHVVKQKLGESNEKEIELFYNILNNYKGKIQNRSNKPLDLPIQYKTLLTDNMPASSHPRHLQQALRKDIDKKL